MDIDTGPIELSCSIRKGVGPWRWKDGGGLEHDTVPCPNTATRWTPVERTDDGVAVRKLQQPVCDGCNEMNYRDKSVAIGEAFDWDTDPRVLRYDAQQVMAGFKKAIDNLS